MTKSFESEATSHNLLYASAQGATQLSIYSPDTDGLVFALRRYPDLCSMSLITLALLSWKPLLTSVGRNSQMTAQEVEWNTWFVGCTNERQTSKLLKAFRWSLFKKNQAKSERLQPRQAALHQAILRVHYHLLV